MNARNDEYILVDLGARAGINFKNTSSDQWPQFIIHSIRNKVRDNYRRPWFTRFMLFFSGSKVLVLASFGVRIVYKELMDMVFFMSIEDIPPFHPSCKCRVGDQ